MIDCPGILILSSPDPVNKPFTLGGRLLPCLLHLKILLLCLRDSNKRRCYRSVHLAKRLARHDVSLYSYLYRTETRTYSPQEKNCSEASHSIYPRPCQSFLRYPHGSPLLS